MGSRGEKRKREKVRGKREKGGVIKAISLFNPANIIFSQVIYVWTTQNTKGRQTD